MEYLMSKEADKKVQPYGITCDGAACMNTCTAGCFNRCVTNCTNGCAFEYNSAR